MIFCITETFFHTSFLFQKLRMHDIQWIVRNERNLDIATLSKVHAELSGKKYLTDKDISALQRAYGGLSQPELYLAKKYGVPRSHAMSSALLVDTKNLSKNFLNKNKDEMLNSSPDGAIVFLDVILDKCWLDFFENKIINAHSAVLPFARGMYAIEQVAALGVPQLMENAAGATIHYVDTGIDTGAIIRRERINNIWMHESIWAVKGESYLLAFQLLDEYLCKKNKFTLTDVIPDKNINYGPLFMRKTFTPEIKKIVEKRFLEMKEDVINV